MLERNEIVPDALKEDIINARNAIAQLTENGLDLSEVSIEQLNSILFSDNPNETLKGVAENISEEKKRELLKTEAEKIVNNGIPVTLDDDNYAEWDVNLLQEKLTRLAEIFESKKYRYRVKTKKELVMSFIAKVAKDIESEQSRGDNYNKSMFHYDREYGSYADEFPHGLLEMATNFPSLNLSKKEVLRFCAEHVNQDPDSIYHISAG